MYQNVSAREQKLADMLRYAPLGLVETDNEGNILEMNIKGEELLYPFMQAHMLDMTNIFPLLNIIKPGIADSITGFEGEIGVAFNDLIAVTLPGQASATYLNIMANKQVDATFMVSFDDVTERQSREIAIRQMELEKAVSQGKFEIASEVLHDIGNAVVGFGSYLTRTRRQLEHSSLENLKKLCSFFEAHKPQLNGAIGNEKAAAIIALLGGIYDSQEKVESEIGKSVTEQLNIIAHIQEILNIQRQYISGHQGQERKPVNLRGLINDCLAMLFASFDKRGIDLVINVPEEQFVVKGDRTKLMQVLMNILKNSLEAIEMQATEKKITIDLTSKKDLIRLKITDTGTGFDKETGSRLFERGFTTKHTGSGLGLYNCKTIIESHAATLRLTSQGPGRGAVTLIEFNAN